MSSENVPGADNQQGRPKELISPEYISGFVDGEGFFSVSIRPHPKQADFLKFREVVQAMQRKVNPTRGGYQRIVKTAFSVNQRGKQRRYKLDEILAEPSETVRRASVNEAGDETVRASWRHGESGRNDLATLVAASDERSNNDA